jgi:hypothetical protein
MAINTKNQKAIDLLNLSIQYRGKLIHNVCFLEMVLNAYIANYFCSSDDKKMSDMIVLMLGDDRTSLGSKAQIFNKLATEYDSNWYDSYKSIRKPVNKKIKYYAMGSDLFYVIEERNVFAHRIYDAGVFATEELPNDTIRFTRFKNEILPNDYDKTKFDELLQVTINLKDHFEKIVRVPGTYPLSI